MALQPRTKFQAPFLLIMVFFSFSMSTYSQNLLSNGNFENGFSQWTNLAQNGSEATFSLETSVVSQGAYAMKVDITTPGPNQWDVQSIHNGWTAETGIDYTLSFMAKAESDGAGFISVQQNSTYTQEQITLTTSYEKYTWLFTAEEENLQLKFHFPNAGVFYIDDVSIEGGSGDLAPEPSGRRLRTIVEDKYPDGNLIIGGTTGAWALGSITELLMDREFNYVTPENDFKQWNIHPDPDSWNWVQTDAWAAHIAENGQILRMHCPIGPQCSSWSQEDSRTGEELELLMREFMQAVCERYNGTEGVVSLDVVNEVVQGGNWKTPEEGTGGWEMPWYKIGLDTDDAGTPLFIRYAFEIANEYAPNLQMIFNHHEDPNQVGSWNMIKSTIGYLRDLGLRVDGIGWQAHLDNGWATAANLNKLRDLIDWAFVNDLEFHITEASVWIKDAQTAAAFQTQADTYAKILEVLVEKSASGKVGWNIWHIDDNSGWNNEWVPSLFDTDYEAKPAYYAIQAVLENEPESVEEKTKEALGIKPLENYPNPFKNLTTIRITLPEQSHVTLEVYNASGQRVRVLMDEERSSGSHTITWDGSDASGGRLYPGIYLLRLDAGEASTTKRVVIMQ